MPSDIFAKRRLPYSEMSLRDYLQQAAMAAPPYAPMAEAAPGAAARALRFGEIAPGQGERVPPGTSDAVAAALMGAEFPGAEPTQRVARAVRAGEIAPGASDPEAEAAAAMTRAGEPYRKRSDSPITDAVVGNILEAAGATGTMGATAAGSGTRTVARPPEAAPMDPILEFWQQMQRENAGPATGR